MAIEITTFDSGLEYYAELERAIKALRKTGKFVFPYRIPEQYLDWIKVQYASRWPERKGEMHHIVTSRVFTVEDTDCTCTELKISLVPPRSVIEISLKLSEMCARPEPVFVDLLQSMPFLNSWGEMKDAGTGEPFKIEHIRQRFAKFNNQRTSETSYIWKDKLYGKEYSLEVLQKEDMAGKQVAVIKE